MTRRRLRDVYPAADLRAIYERSYRCWDRGDDHIERVHTTAGFVAGIMHRRRLRRLADLSTGDGTLPRAVTALKPDVSLYLGDLVPAIGLDVSGPIEKTLVGAPPADLLVCSETLEHLDDPDAVLQLATEVADWLVVSTPIDEQTAENPEHYWSWSPADVEQMLVDVGWQPRTYATLAPEPGYYRFQLWAASRR